jgi:hypothetical protein
MRCTVKNSLLKSYRDFTAGYVRAIKRMKKRTPAMSQSDFSSLRDLAKDCEMKSEKARRLLQRHITEHHC